MRESGLLDIRVVPDVFMPPYPIWRRLVGGTLTKALEARAVPAPELEHWWSELDAAEREGRFFAGDLGFIVTGRKP